MKSKQSVIPSAAAVRLLRLGRLNVWRKNLMMLTCEVSFFEMYPFLA